MTPFVAIEKFPIAGDGFTTSRETKRDAIVVHVVLEKDGLTGEGEGFPLKRFHYTPEGIQQEIEDYLHSHPIDRQVLNNVMKAGPARFALDTAMWQLEAAQKGQSFKNYFGPTVKDFPTAFTISGAAPEVMAVHAATMQHHRWLKIKLMGDGQDMLRLSAVHAAAPQTHLIVDANESLTTDSLMELLPIFEKNNVVLIEQPLSEGQDEALLNFTSTIPLVADESCHTIDDLEKLHGKYDVVNIKLDKTGGLTHAQRMIARAREMGFQIMLGCMASTWLSIYPAALLAGSADYIDLDGAMLLVKDRDAAKLAYRDGRVFLLD